MSEKILRMVESKFGLNHTNDLVSYDGIYARAPGNRSTALAAATLTVTQELHDGKTIIVNKADGSTLTLPAATGSGAKYRIYVGTTITSVGLIAKVANATDVFAGHALGSDGDGGGATGYSWNTAAASDTITLDGSATGGRKGDVIEIEDVETGFFSIKALLTQSGGAEATPFSATVS